MSRPTGAPEPADGSRSLAADRRGAVYVEFLVAFLPVFFFFLSLVQFTFLQGANLVVKHAATTAVRAAIVVLHDDPSHYDDVPTGRATGKRREDIERAARIPLAVLGVRPDALKLEMAESFERDAQVTVKLEYRYRCQVPWGRSVVCSFLTNERTLRAEATMPNQGVAWRY